MARNFARNLVVAVCCLSSPLFGGTSSIEFVACQDRDGVEVVNLELETNLEETVAISVQGKIKIGGIRVDSFQSPVEAAELVPAGGGGYRFGVGGDTYFIAWPEEHGATLQLVVGEQEFFYGACVLNEEKVSQLVQKPNS